MTSHSAQIQHEFDSYRNVHKEFYGNSHFISTKVESDYGRRLKMAMDIICQYDFKLHFCEYSYAEFTFRFELHNFVYKIC